MNFLNYQELARKVLPDLPEEFENMPDTLDTFQWVICFLCPKNPIDKSNWDAWQNHEFHSLMNMTVTQIDNYRITGHSCWNKK